MTPTIPCNQTINPSDSHSDTHHKALSSRLESESYVHNDHAHYSTIWLPPQHRPSPLSTLYPSDSHWGPHNTTLADTVSLSHTSWLALGPYPYRFFRQSVQYLATLTHTLPLNHSLWLPIGHSICLTEISKYNTQSTTDTKIISIYCQINPSHSQSDPWHIEWADFQLIW